MLKTLTCALSVVAVSSVFACSAGQLELEDDRTSADAPPGEDGAGDVLNEGTDGAEADDGLAEFAGKYKKKQWKKKNKRDAGADAPTPPTDPPPSDPPTDPPSTSTIWRPAPGTSWQWQIDGGSIDTSFNVQMYDIDLFETSAATIASIHAKGAKVVCYFDTAYEPGRPDSSKLAPYKGNPIDGWPGQYWLDVRQPTVLSVMKSRIALAQSKGCDGIEADDVDVRSNNPGFPITAAEQRSFIRAMADEAHAKGMSYGLKNALDDVGALLPYVDFAINEECFAYDECSMLSPFIKAGKAVFQVEYTSGSLSSKGASICPKANAMNFDTLIKRLDLGPERYSCR